ncbi:MAG: TRAP transporter permease [Clostridia bacterium]|nr:TRAP transporter permease [Clostridia bacterium]
MSSRKKAGNLPARPDTGDAAAPEEIRADVQSIMRKYDRESNTRVWEGVPKIIVSVLLAFFSLYCIYVTLFANFLEQVRLSSFMGLILVMGYLTYPARKGQTRVNHMPWSDIVLMLLGAAAFFYFTFRAPVLMKTRIAIKLKDPVYIIAGIVGLVTLCELCRRCVGLPILCVAGAFLAYTIYFYVKDGKLLVNVVHELFYNENGLLSTPVNVCSKYIVVFIIFGAFLEKTGISEYFISLANGLTGRFAGGPAKVAVVSSALCGMVSGSSVGNTVTTGSMTIPMMKKTGYEADFAGAVEAAASTGGQIMPPIMGAAAFLMADYLGVPYSDIIVRAILPAVLYFLGVFLTVHLEAKKLGLRGMSREELPRMRELVKESYLLLPLFILIYLVCSNTRTMQFSAAVAIVATIVVGIISNLLRRRRRAGTGAGADAAAQAKPFTALNVFEALENGGRSCISVAVACGIAGIICGCLTITGLASTVINEIVLISQNNMFLAMVLTMVCCIILGMGIPTTATYCIMASTCAPILIKMGVPMVAAHFFVFYYGIVADITPPVALAAYAGAAISGGSPLRTGIHATRLAIAGFIIPFIFALSPSLLLVDTHPLELIQIIITSVIGMYGISFGLSGFRLRNRTKAQTAAAVIQRILAIAGGLLLISPGTVTDLIGIALVAAALIWHHAVLRSAKSEGA